jgi:uncharacterized protein YjbI with pentapeptide repeats
MGPDDLHDAKSPADRAAPIPAVEAEAQDLEALRKGVEDSASISGGLWLSYLFVLFYLAIAAGAVTHADLLLQNPVKLPFLNIELPLRAFFLLAPLLFVITHAYALVNLVVLANRVRQFHHELRDQTANPTLRIALTRQLPSHVFVQFLGGPEETHKGAFGGLLAAILWITLVGTPIALLLLLQIQFLPYHDLLITWTTRAVLILDLGLIWWLWRNILGSRTDERKASFWRSSGKLSAAATISVLTILFACALATIPGECQEDYLPMASVRNALFHGSVNPTTRRRGSLFSNTLVLPDFSIFEAMKIDDPSKTEWRQYLVNLRGRDLKGAVLYGAVLPKADFTAARLQSAVLVSADLRGALFLHARLQGASLDDARLQGAALVYAQLQGASLHGAELQGASLAGAQLQGASLDDAGLQGAVLASAKLQGVTFDNARLQGASLNRAELEGTSLKATLLWRAQLTGANFKDLLASPNWSWTDVNYIALIQSIQQISRRDVRDAALERVAILDCTRKAWHGAHAAPRPRVAAGPPQEVREGEALASCDPSADLPNVVKEWKTRIERATDGQDIYAKVLAKILGDLVCSETPDRIDVLRGLLRANRFDLTGNEMSALAKRITKCPVSKALTDADKRVIAEARQRATETADQE